MFYVVGTECFWKKMCDPAFQRIDIWSGQLNGDIIFTNMPPEMTEGFLDEKVHKINKLLRPGFFYRLANTLFSRTVPDEWKL